MMVGTRLAAVLLQVLVAVVDVVLVLVVVVEHFGRGVRELGRGHEYLTC